MTLQTPRYGERWLKRKLGLRRWYTPLDVLWEAMTDCVRRAEQARVADHEDRLFGFSGRWVVARDDVVPELRNAVLQGASYLFYDHPPRIFFGKRWCVSRLAGLAEARAALPADSQDPVVLARRIAFANLLFACDRALQQVYPEWQWPQRPKLPS